MYKSMTSQFFKLFRHFVQFCRSWYRSHTTSSFAQCTIKEFLPVVKIFSWRFCSFISVDLVSKYLVILLSPFLLKMRPCYFIKMMPGKFKLWITKRNSKIPKRQTEAPHLPYVNDLYNILAIVVLILSVTACEVQILGEIVFTSFWMVHSEG